MKEAVIIGGPNGAGKTTAAFKLLPHTLISSGSSTRTRSRGLSPFDPESVAMAAGRLMLDRIRELIEAANNRGIAMSDLTGRQIIEKIFRTLEENGRHFAAERQRKRKTRRASSGARTPRRIKPKVSQSSAKKKRKA
jgi:predicted ABC-type ATPase